MITVKGPVARKENIGGLHVAVGFMPAFKYRQKNSLIVSERGHKAHGYVLNPTCFHLSNGPHARGG